MFTCARCGETVTVPYRFQGQVYGYTCIGLVRSGFTRQDKLVQVEFVKAKQIGSSQRFKVTAGFSGYIWIAFGDRDQDYFIFQDGKLFIRESLRKRYTPYINLAK